jgi:hypothetical protein
LHLVGETICRGIDRFDSHVERSIRCYNQASAHTTPTIDHAAAENGG